jgi:ribosomal protein S18 acetylase RimI-like enzyme
MAEVVSLHDKSMIREFALRQPLRYIYEIGDLDDFFWPNTIWYGWQVDGRIEQLALIYIPFEEPVILTHANPDRNDHDAFVRALFRLLPSALYAHVDDDTAQVMRERYQVEPHGHYLKMGLADVTQAVRHDDGRAQLLTVADVPALHRLYAAAYPGNWFDARMVQTGFYTGIWQGSELVAASGIHVVSVSEGVAALGNVTSLPALRGQGLARSSCARLIRAMHEQGIGHIGLNVSASNAAAIKLYQNLGFTKVAEYDEWSFKRV